MNLEKRLSAIEKKQNKILAILQEKKPASTLDDEITKDFFTLTEAAKYAGYSYDHFRRLAIEQRQVGYFRPSGKQQGKIFFHRKDLDLFLQKNQKEKVVRKRPGRKRVSTNLVFW